MGLFLSSQSINLYDRIGSYVSVVRTLDVVVDQELEDTLRKNQARRCSNTTSLTHSLHLFSTWNETLKFEVDRILTITINTRVLDVYEVTNFAYSQRY